MSKKLQVGGGLLILGIINLLIAGTSFAGTSVNDVQSAITAKHAGWSARENWVTKLPRDQVIRMMGVQKAPNHDAEFMVPEGSIKSFRKVALPASVDWRNVNGVNYVSPILNQGNCGSCVAFSTVATLETQLNVSSGIPGLNAQFSTQALFSCGGGACDFGWEPDLAAQYLKTTGVPDEACSPYTEGATGVDVDCGSICSDHAARAYKIADFTAPTANVTNIDAVRAALQNGPLETTLTVYDDFLFYSSGVYKHTTGSEAGGHAVSIVGYNDTDRAWIVRNSWGPDWGENGFVRVSYDDISGIGSNTWQYILPKVDGYVSLANPRNRDFLAGTAHLQASSTFGNTSSVDVNITNLAGKTATTVSCQNPNCSMDVDTTTLTDGTYDAVAVAHVGTQTEQSQHEVFYVVNKAPTMSLTFTGASDLTKPLTDRVVFNLSPVSSSVPYSSLVFHVAQNGTDVYTKEAEIVVPQGMTLGWRTGSVPNGTYDIYFTGQIAPEGLAPYTTASSHVTVSVKN